MHRLILSAPAAPAAEILIHADAAELVAGAAELIVAQAAEAIGQRGRFAIALSGGNTPRPVYEHLAGPACSGRIAWPHVHVFFGDERCVPPEDPHSNYHMARLALLDHVPIPPENVHRMQGEGIPDASAEAYAQDLRNCVGTDGKLDLVLLGLGDNGHTASLFPGLAVVTEHARLVMAAYVEVAGMWRITLTPAAINAARQVVFLVSGNEKAAMLHRVLQGPREPIVLPAQAIQPVSSRTLWLVDKAAAAELQQTS